MHRKPGEKVVIDGNIYVQVCEVRVKGKDDAGNPLYDIKLGFDAPREVEIYRMEVQRSIERHGRMGPMERHVVNSRKGDKSCCDKYGNMIPCDCLERARIIDETRTKKEQS